METGASQSACSYGEAADSGDKGVNKAKTCALKRWFLDTFHLTEGGEDPDDYGPSGAPSSSVVAPSGSTASAPSAQPSKPQTTVTADSKPYEPTPPQRKAIENIVRKYREKADAGEVGEEDFKRLAEECAAISSAKDAVDFITKFRV